MVEYFKKLKEAVNQPQAPQQLKVVEDIKEVASMVNKVRQLEAQINELTKWKNSDAIPTMKKNITNITTIHTDITKNIVPTLKQNVADVKQTAVEVRKAMDTAVTAANKATIINNTVNEISNKVIEASKIANDSMSKSIKASEIAQLAANGVNNALTKATNASSIAQQAANIATSSISSAKEALTKATDIYQKFQLAAAQLKVDTEALGDASTKLITSIELEMKAIKDQFISFGSKVYTSTLVIGKNMEYTGKELKEAYNQIRVPLEKVNLYAKRSRDDNIIFLPYNIFATIFWGFLK